jgi:hypothetical protein
MHRDLCHMVRLAVNLQLVQMREVRAVPKEGPEPSG